MKKYFFFFFLIIFLTQNIYALGIAQEYVKDGTLKLYPGQERLFRLAMQNPDNAPVKVNLTVTGDIVKIQDRQETYLLPAKSFSNVVFLNISVPENATINETYTIRYSMAPAKENKSDPSIKIGMKISQPIQILVIPEPGMEKEKVPLKNKMVAIIGFIILIFTFWRLGSLMNKKINKK